MTPCASFKGFERNFAVMVDTAAKLPGYFTAPEDLQMPFDEDELDDDDDLDALRQRWLDQNMKRWTPTTRPTPSARNGMA